MHVIKRIYIWNTVRLYEGIWGPTKQCQRTQRSFSSSVLDGLVNWEQRGIPRAAGTIDSSHFDLSRMRRLLEVLGSPQSSWPSVHVAGTKGRKGS